MKMKRNDLIKDLAIKLKSVCCIGPQLSYKSIYDNDNKVIVSKEITKVLSSIYDNDDNPYMHIIIDIIADYESKHGSGSSSLLAYITYILLEITTVVDIDDIDISTIISTLNTVNNSFIDICNAMKLNIKNDITSKNKETLDNIDDVSWYFDNNDNSNNNNNNNNDDNKDKSIWTDNNIAIGLQHSCYWDYEFNSDMNESSVSLPMRLAFEAIVDKQQQTSSSTYDTGIISNMITNISMNKGNDDNDSNNTIILLLPGLPVKYCTAVQDAIIITLHDRNSINTLHDYINDKSVTDSSIVFSSIAIVQGEFESGSMGEGGGASEQMRKFTNSRILKDDIDDFKTFLRSSSETNYLQFCRKRLEQLGVDLLIVSNTYMSSSLTDVFKASSIVVIAIHQNSCLHNLAKMADATIVNDILQLGSKQIGKHPITLSVLMRRQFQNKLSSKDITRSTHSYSYNGISGVFGDPRDGIFITGYDPSTTDELVLQFQYTHRKKTNEKVSSILIASPSLPQANALADRCHRCLFRLKSIVSGMPIIPGAGIPELMLSLHLKNIPLCNEDRRLITAVEEALISYIMTVNISNGYSWIESMERTRHCKSQFFTLCHASTSINILKELSRLSKENNLMNISPPIFDPNRDTNLIEMNDNRILDCLDIKIEVFNTAIQCIKQVLSIVVIVKTN